MPPKPTTTTTHALAPDLWAVDYNAYDKPLHMSLRMTVVRLRDGRLWLHSPVPLDDTIATWLAELGEVAYIVAPSRFHHMFAGRAARRDPASALWLAPELPKKRPTLRCDGLLDADAMPWDAELATLPLEGAPLQGEVVFFHRASGTFICTDFLFNLRDEPHWPTRWVYRAMGIWRRFGSGRIWWLMTKDRAALARSVETILSWDIKRIAMAHGEVMDGECVHNIRKACARWLPLTPMLTEGSG